MRRPWPALGYCAEEEEGEAEEEKGAWISVSCECCVFSGRYIREGPIPRPEEFYRLWRIIVCDLETSRMRWPWPALGCCAVELLVEARRYKPEGRVFDSFCSL
jgi:hypothetical protein